MATLETFVELESAFAQVANRATAFQIACGLAGRLGFPHVIHAPIRNHPEAARNWSATTYPAAWQECYIAKGYLHRNPVRQRAETSSVPFLWSSLEPQLSREKRELFEDCRACGMQEGYVVPVHGPWGQAVAIGFACQSRDAVTAPARSALHLLAHKLHLAVDLPQNDHPVRLTAREKQILILLGSGAMNPEIADRLFISDNSVEWHLKNIFRKLDVRNRTAAVIKAVQMGLLQV